LGLFRISYLELRISLNFIEGERRGLFQNILGTIGDLAKNLLFEITQWSGRVLGGMKIEGNWRIILDIIIVAFIIYWFLSKILESKAARILYGIIIVFFLLLFGHFLNLLTLNWLLKYLGIMMAVVIPIIFQPEIRAALDKLGRFGLSNRSKFSKTTLEEILVAISFLSRYKKGAIIALERKIPLKDYAKSGHILHADVSKELILSIFSPQSPLHDGAILISGDKIIASGCMFPMPEEKEALGARHRSAKSLSAHTDAIVLVVSGETGAISIAFEGTIESNLQIKDIKRILEKAFSLD